MLLTILAFIIVGLVCFLIGMIIESAFENNSKKEPEQETIKVIEINDNREQLQVEQDQKDYFKPFWFKKPAGMRVRQAQIKGCLQPYGINRQENYSKIYFILQANKL